MIPNCCQQPGQELHSSQVQHDWACGQTGAFTSIMLVSFIACRISALLSQIIHHGVKELRENILCENRWRTFRLFCSEKSWLGKKGELCSNIKRHCREEGITCLLHILWARQEAKFLNCSKVEKVKNFLSVKRDVVEITYEEGMELPPFPQMPVGHPIGKSRA